MEKTRKMNWWQRLGVKIPAITLLMALGPLLIFGTTAIRQGEAVLMENIRQSNRIAINHAILRTETLIQHTLQRMSMAADTLEIIGMDRFDQQYALQRIQKEIPQLKTVALIDKDGKETARVDLEKVFPEDMLTNRSRDPAFVQGVTNRPYIGPVKTLDSGSRMLTLAVPLVSARERSVCGVLTAQASVRNLLEEIPSMKVGGHGFIYVVDPGGQMIAHPDLSRVLAGESIAENRHFRRFLHGDKDHLKELHRHLNTKGKDVLSMGIQSASLGWVFMVEHPAAEAMALVNTQKRDLEIWMAVIVSAAILGALYIIVGFARPLGKLHSAAESLGSGNLDLHVDIASNDEIGRVAREFNAMAENLKKTAAAQHRMDWLKTGQVELDNHIRGQKTIKALAHEIIAFLAQYLDAQVGMFCIRDKDDTLRFKAGYASKDRFDDTGAFKMGEGLIGQAATDGKSILLDDVPEDYCQIVSGLGDTRPVALIIVPLVYENAVAGVVELGFDQRLSHTKRDFLEDVSERIAIAVISVQDRERLQQALEFSREQAERLATQQEELRAANEELEEQTLAMQERLVDK